MERETQEILSGRAYVFKRDDTPFWYAAAFLNGKNYRHSTKLTELTSDIRDAEDWYISLKSKAEAGVLPHITPRWVQGHEIRLRVHLIPVLGDTPISKIDSAKIQEYRVMRMTPKEDKNPHAADNRPHKAGKLPAAKTLHNEIVTLRLVLKAALRRRLINVHLTNPP